MPHYNVLCSVVRTVEAPTPEIATIGLLADLILGGYEVYESGEVPLPHTPHVFEVEPELDGWETIARDSEALLRRLFAA